MICVTCKKYNHIIKEACSKKGNGLIDDKTGMTILGEFLEEIERNTGAEDLEHHYIACEALKYLDQMAILFNAYLSLRMAASLGKHHAAPSDPATFLKIGTAISKATFQFLYALDDEESD